MKPTYEELEAKCAALAAENAGLKKVPATDSETMLLALDAFNTHGSTRPDAGLKQAINFVMQRRQTPATDAFLAEVRAAAVDEVCLKISNAIVNCYQDEQVGLDAAATICGDFAAQLRKGVQS